MNIILTIVAIAVCTWLSHLLRPETIEVEGTMYSVVHIGDLLDEYVHGRLPKSMRLPTIEEWEKFATKRDSRFSPFQEIRRGEPGILAGDTEGNMLAVLV